MGLLESLELSLDSAEWLTDSDAGARGTALRLARQLDAMFDAGESRDLAPLLSRYTALLHALRLTPESRQDSKAEVIQDDKQIDQIIGGALRLVNSSDSVDAVSGSKPRGKR